MAAKFFTGLPLDGPDPECVQGYGETRAGRRPDGPGGQPGPLRGRRRRRNQPVMLTLTAVRTGRHRSAACAENPLAGFRL